MLVQSFLLCLHEWIMGYRCVIGCIACPWTNRPKHKWYSMDRELSLKSVFSCWNTEVWTGTLLSEHAIIRVTPQILKRLFQVLLEFFFESKFDGWACCNLKLWYCSKGTSVVLEGEFYRISPLMMYMGFWSPKIYVNESFTVRKCS